ncbi:uncharacterized protein LOC108327168 [Vigna angularis]|uniref:uncharacterized protein LOC108327168 n=1 Tax=Phaseolus angularis TaxID=3914 RepID=UPI00080A3889|nr:uncharacterized protein LOC108327168 [Vigna angularis]
MQRMKDSETIKDYADKLLGVANEICLFGTDIPDSRIVQKILGEEEDLFVVSCFATARSTKSWLIDSGCTNHMTYNKELFKDLDATYNTNVRIGNGAKIVVKDKGTIVIEGCTGLKLIIDVLYVPEIDQNLLSVGQLLEKGYKIDEEQFVVHKVEDNMQVQGLPQLEEKSFDFKGPKKTPSLNDKKVDLVGVKVGESQNEPKKLEEEEQLKTTLSEAEAENAEKLKEQPQVDEEVAEDCKDLKTKKKI